MPTRSPARLDPRQLAASGEQLHVRLPLGSCERMADLLADTHGEVDVTLAAVTDDHGRPRLAGRVRAKLHMVCQRCLCPAPVVVDSVLDLALVPAGSRDTEAPGQDEVLEVPEGGIVLSELVCDELLLAVPMAPVHVDVAECRANGYRTPEPATDRPHPFAALGELVRRR